MYASPSASVIALAVAADMAPPATVPTPGMTFSKFETIALPTNVAPVTPIAAAIPAYR